MVVLGIWTLMGMQIADAMEPNLAYFTDPSQNFVSNFFQALTPAGTSLGAVQGVLVPSRRTRGQQHDVLRVRAIM